MKLVTVGLLIAAAVCVIAGLSPNVHVRGLLGEGQLQTVPLSRGSRATLFVLAGVLLVIAWWYSR